ncbi:MAG: GMC oxidoreductase, partial [Burkholderiales bacterium]
VLRPKSRGSIKLASANPATAPVIQPNYYSNREDLALMIAGLKISRALTQTSAFGDITVEEAVPGLSVNDDKGLEAYIRETGDTLFHPVGTCKMGTDAQAVVDPHLCVHGVQGLRVIDASIMPSITSGPTNAPAIMIGEKGADMIRTTHATRA